MSFNAGTGAGAGTALGFALGGFTPVGALIGAGIGGLAGGGMGYMSERMTPGTPDMPRVTPAVKPPKESDAAIVGERRAFYAQQLAAAGKNKTIGTNPLGNASDVLQTSRKALLGGA